MAWICLAFGLLIPSGLMGQVVSTSSSNKPISEQFRWMPVPATLTSPGKPGDFASDGTDLYIYTGTGRPPHSWIVAGSGGGGTWGGITGTLSAQTDLQSALDGKQDAGSYANAQSITDLSGGGPYALTLGPAPFPKYRVTISAATTFTVSGSPNAGDGAIIENIVTGAPRVVTYPTAYRNNAAATSTSVSVSSPRSDFTLVYTGTEYRWYDQEYGADDKSSIDYAADAGSTDSYAITLNPAPTAYTTGTQYRFKANTANTGAATININGLGAKTIKKVAGGITTDLADNDIRAGQHVLLVYDGTNMQMQSTSGNAAAGGGSSQLLTPFTAGSAEWTNMPTSTNFLNSGTSGYAGSGVNKVDLDAYTQVRLVVNVLTPADTGGKIRCRYATSFSSTAGSYSAIGASEVEVTVDSGGVKDTGWINLVAGAKVANVFIAALGENPSGGTTDPIFNCIVYFK